MRNPVQPSISTEPEIKSNVELIIRIKNKQTEKKTIRKKSKFNHIPEFPAEGV